MQVRLSLEWVFLCICNSTVTSHGVDWPQHVPYSLYFFRLLACLPRLPRSTPAHIICKVYLMGPGHVSTSMRGVKRECVQHETLAGVEDAQNGTTIQIPYVLLD